MKNVKVVSAPVITTKSRTFWFENVYIDTKDKKLSLGGPAESEEAADNQRSDRYDNTLVRIAVISYED